MTVLVLVLAGFVLITLISVNGLKDSLLQEKQQQTRYLVESAHALVSHYHQQALDGALTTEQAQARSVSALRALRYDGDNYFWINDKGPVLVMHPHEPALIGKSLSDLQDANGKYLFNEFVEVVNRDGEGTVQYMWPKPGRSQPVEKVSYVKVFTPWDWIIGSGIYVDDVEDAFHGSALFLGVVATSITLLVFSGIVIIRRDMLHQRQRYALIDASHSQLEQQIDERTAQLKSANEALTRSVEEALGDKKQLAANEALFRGMTEAAQDAIVLVDEEVQVVFWNGAAERLFGISAREARGQRLYPLVVSVFEQSALESVFTELLESGLSRTHGGSGEFMARHQSGNNFPAELSVNNLVIDSAQQFICIIRDVSERKRAEEALIEKNHQQTELITNLKAAQKQLLHSEKLAALGQLSAGVAHEINNPVGFISGNINCLRDYTADMVAMFDQIKSRLENHEDSEKLLGYISEAEQACGFAEIRDDLTDVLSETKEGVDRIKKIVVDLKGFARASDGEWEKADLHKEIDSTLNLVRNELKYHCTVNKQYGELPLVECLKSEISQVVMNLLINASHAIEDKGVITIRTGADTDSVWIEIEDTGKGIDPDVLPKIFDPFFTTKAVGKGTGLGLSVSYGIVEKHHGQLSVTSTVGVGTKFTLIIPISHTEISTPDSVTPGSASSDSTSSDEAAQVNAS